MVEEKLSAGFSIVFSRFIIFIGLLVFTAGAIFISFMVFAMMAQRIRDIGLMRAAGCPNNLIFGYFMNELLIVAFISCFLGVILGLSIDFALANILKVSGFQISQKPANFLACFAGLCSLFHSFAGFWSKTDFECNEN